MEILVCLVFDGLYDAWMSVTRITDTNTSYKVYIGFTGWII